MSNFICSECGMTNIDCGCAGYKTPKEIELEKKVHILNEANMKLENELGHFADISKKVERFQEQLNEANDALIKSQNMKQPDRNNYVAQYLLKWGVK